MSASKMSPLSILTAPIRLALFDPRVTAPLLIALLYYPEKLRELLPERVHPFITSQVAIRTLSVLLSWGVLRSVNRKLSQWTANNWKKDARFVKSQELVLISGGCSGIGKLMAEDFAKRGVRVVVLDLNSPKTAPPSGVYFYQCDVTDSKKIAAAAAQIRKEHGEPTVLINNAGIGTGLPILESTEQIIQKTFEVNTISHFWMVREFLPAMIKKNHGHVVTIASMASFVVASNIVDYGCTKASAIAFHEGLHAELRSKYNAPDVRTTVVNPTWIRTPLIEALTSHPNFKDTVLEPEEVSSAIVNQVVSGRGGQLILPAGHSFLCGIRGWPSWLQIALRNKVSDMAKKLDGIDVEAAKRDDRDPERWGNFRKQEAN